MKPPNFNFIAPLYRWLEYLTLGPFLTRTRTHFLPSLTYTRRALVLGDGDGRFTVRLFQTASVTHITAVDTSRTMLRLLTRRARPFAARLTTHHADALTFTPTNQPDLIVTHFFLDCLTQPQLDSLALHLAAHSTPRAQWLVSEFTIPSGPLHYPSCLAIRILYLVFRILAGLRVTHLPDHVKALRAAGFTLHLRHRHLFGTLSSELWQQAPPPPR